MIKELAQSPAIYALLARVVLPWARRSAEFTRAHMNLLIGCTVVGAISQGWAGSSEIINAGSLMWAMATVGSMLVLVQSFKRLPELLAEILAAVHFVEVLVTWLRSILVLRKPIQLEFALPVQGVGDPARPLQLRI